MNANIEELFQKWLDPVAGVMKLCNACDAWATGELIAELNITVYLAILDTAIGGFLLCKLLSPWVNRQLIRISEAKVVRRFAKLRSKSLCPFALKAKLLGGRTGKSQSIGAAVASMTPRLIEFTEL